MVGYPDDGGLKKPKSPFEFTMFDLVNRTFRPMTTEERFEQRVSFVYGQLSQKSTITKDTVRQILRMEK